MLAQEDEEPEVVLGQKNEALERAIDKVGLMSKLIYKSAYSRRIMYKRHIINQHKLNEFLGQNLFEEPEEGETNSMKSDLSRIDKFASNRVTYAELLQRIETAERNFNETEKKFTGKSKPAADAISSTRGSQF